MLCERGLQTISEEQHRFSFLLLLAAVLGVSVEERKEQRLEEALFSTELPVRGNDNARSLLTRLFRTWHSNFVGVPRRNGIEFTAKT